MLRKRIDHDGAMILKSISSEEDLKIKGRININPPPENGRCECCGKHIRELKPFVDTKHPIFGNIKGAILVKNFRITTDLDHGEENDWKYVKKLKGLRKKQSKTSPDDILMVKSKFTNGRWDIYNASFIESSFYLISSWECVDCLDLSNEKYLTQKYEKKYRKGEKNYAELGL
jgi:hypothetical protein